MKKWQRTLLIGFIWGIIFLWWYIRGFLIFNWGFDIFSLKNTEDTVGWLFLIDEFRKGWVIEGASNVIFFIILLLTFPLYFLGWRYFLKIEWLKLLRKTVNRIRYFFTGEETAKKQNANQFQLKKKSSKNTRPRALDGSIRPDTKESELKVPVNEPVLPNTQKQTGDSAYGSMSGTGGNPYAGGNAYGMGGANAPYSGHMNTSYTPPADSPFNKGFSLPSMDKGFSMTSSMNDWENSDDAFRSDSFDDMLISDIKLPERVRVEENIVELFDHAGYTVLQNVIIGGKPVEYVAISETRVIVAIEDTQSGDWLADEERFNGEDPLWFSESSHRISPIFQMLEMVKDFMSRLADNGFSGTVLPMFIERNGIIINAEDMQTTWKDLSVIVCRTDLGGPDELKTVEQSIIAGEKPSEEVIQKVRMSL